MRSGVSLAAIKSMATDPSTTLEHPLKRDGLAALLRQVLLRGIDGKIFLEGAFRAPLLLVAGTDLFVDSRHPLLASAGDVAAAVRRDRRAPLWDSPPRLAGTMRDLAARIPWDGAKTARFVIGSLETADETLGPYPVGALAADVATSGLDEEALIASLGGEGNRFRTAGELDLLRRIPRLSALARDLLGRLGEPASVADLVRLKAGGEADVLVLLAELRALGLVRSRSEERRPEAEAQLDTGRVGEDRMERFLGRIAASLGATPLDLLAEEHRVEVARLVGAIGEQTFYDLLGVPVEAEAPAITAAYEDLARKVHPTHAARLQLGGRESVLRLLFERATAAYLTLSDPHRRKSYDLAMEIRPQVAAPSEEEVREVRRAMARSNYERAQAMMRMEDFHYAVELLRDAVHWDPRPEYHALLGDAMSRNPLWRDEALAALEKAAAAQPREPAHRLVIGRINEALERPSQARAAYEKVLELMPNHPEALAGLERIAGRRPSGEGRGAAGTGLLGRLRSVLFGD